MVFADPPPPHHEPGAYGPRGLAAHGPAAGQAPDHGQGAGTCSGFAAILVEPVTLAQPLHLLGREVGGCLVPDHGLGKAPLLTGNPVPIDAVLVKVRLRFGLGGGCGLACACVLGCLYND
jgi:hypothetical protein